MSKKLWPHHLIELQIVQLEHLAAAYEITSTNKKSIAAVKNQGVLIAILYVFIRQQ
jgi:hypothetical protein